MSEDTLKLYLGLSHEKCMDDKGRISIPAKLRKVVIARVGEGRPLYIIPAVRNRGRFLAVYDLHSRIGELGLCEETHMDKQGRVLIAPWQRDYANLVNGIVIAGSFNGENMEIWNADRFNSSYSSSIDNILNPQ